MTYSLSRGKKVEPLLPMLGYTVINLNTVGPKDQPTDYVSESFDFAWPYFYDFTVLLPGRSS